MPRSIRYYDLGPEDDLTCERCSWSGNRDEASTEVFSELMTLDCPKCDSRLLTVLFPTIDEIRSAAAAGNREAAAALRHREPPEHHVAASPGELDAERPADGPIAAPLIDVPHHYASDTDGTRYLVIDDPEADMEQWRVEVQGPGVGAEAPARRFEEFSRVTIWGTGRAANFLGYGERRSAWVALVDHGESAVAVTRAASDEA